MAKLRLGVIGAGSWTVAAHLPALAKRRDEVQFVGVCRRGEEALARVAQRWGFPVASEDYRDVLAAEVDICVVASPAAEHYRHARDALAAGAHVLCEKPMTIHPGHAWELVDATRANGRALLVSFGWNYSPMVRAARRLLETAPIGTVEQFSVRMSSSTRELLSATGSYPDADPETTPEPATWTDPARSGGGYGQAQLSHALGLLLWLVPHERIATVYARTHAAGAPVELHDAAVLTLDGGAIGVLSGGSSHAGAWGDRHALELRAIGRSGELAVDVQRDLVAVYQPGSGERRLDLPDGAGLSRPAGPANALVDVALGRTEENCAPGELGARTVEALDALYRSARSGREEARA